MKTIKTNAVWVLTLVLIMLGVCVSNLSFGQLNKLKDKVKVPVKQESQTKPSSASSSSSNSQVAAQSEEPAAANTVATGKTIYISPAGNNSNDGTDPKAPMKEIDKAMAKAEDGDKFFVSEGTYTGTFGVGYWELTKAVQIYGGYNADFTSRDPFRYLTVIQPPKDAFEKSANRNVFDMKKPLNGVVIDGLIFDGGEKTPYNADPDPKKAGRCEGCETGMMMVGPGQKNPEGVMLVLYGNNHVVRNCIFINSSFGGVRAKIGQGGQGDIEIANNVFVGNRMFGIEGFGLAGKAPEGEINIHHNTILFSWSRLKDLLDFGYGINVQNNATFKIHENIIALNISAGISSQRFNQDLYIDNNLFFGNKKKDFWFNPGSNANVQIDAAEFGDVDIKSASGNLDQNLKLPLENSYLNGFLNAQYSETADYDPNSQANLMRAAFGMNKQGTINSSVSMYANRYPWKKCLELIGIHSKYGVQKATNL